jgi:hypothetical protein
MSKPCLTPFHKFFPPMPLLELIQSPTGPATHAMVIGVGTYIHLKGGTGPQAARQWGLEQIPSAPLSALHFIDWLLNRFDNPTHPLATIEHLISAPSVVTDRSRTKHSSTEPIMANIMAAYTQWIARAGTNPDNIAIFYFCGHGLYNRHGTALLTADFANPVFANLSLNAIHVEATVDCMLACPAKQQCFFIDSCRTIDTAWSDMMNTPGQPLGTAGNANLAAVDQPIFFATGRTKTAIAPDGEVSVFTKALVEALSHMAADDPFGNHNLQTWVVNTANILRAVNDAIRMERIERPWLEGPVCNFGGGGSHFDLHNPKPPLSIPVLAVCKPADLNTQATFKLAQGANVIASGKANGDAWVSRHPPDSYEVNANLDDGRSKSSPINLSPPSKLAVFEF